MKKYLYLRHMFVTVLFLLIVNPLTFADGDDPPQINIWDSTGPGSDSLDIQETITYRSLVGTCTIDRAIEHVTVPTITPFLPDHPNGTAIIICPGGVYERVVYDVEGCDIARWINQFGVSAFVLKYRLPKDTHADSRYVPLQDAQRAIRVVKANAEAWSIDTSRIGIMGASAGGHLAASLGTDFEKNVYAYRDSVDSLNAGPHFMILLYPVISMDSSITNTGTRQNLLGTEYTQELLDEFSAEKHVKPNSPFTFIALAGDDSGVNPENSKRFDQALKEKGIGSELHIYLNGGHGKGICKAVGTDFANWTVDCRNWLAMNALIADSFYVSQVRDYQEKQEPSLIVYPNPVHLNASLLYRIDKRDQIDISVFDATGRMVASIFSGYHPAGSFEIELQETVFPAMGMYIVRVRESERITGQKIMVY